jgi:hypothetical protein
MFQTKLTNKYANKLLCKETYVYKHINWVWKFPPSTAASRIYLTGKQLLFLSKHHLNQILSLLILDDDDGILMFDWEISNHFSFPLFISKKRIQICIFACLMVKQNLFHPVDKQARLLILQIHHSNVKSIPLLKDVCFRVIRLVCDSKDFYGTQGNTQRKTFGFQIDASHLVK